MDLLQPQGWELSKEPIKYLHVEVLQQTREVWEGWLSLELPLWEVVQELLSQPVEDAEGHLVGYPSDFTKMDG